MSKRPVFLVLFALVMLIAGSDVTQASAISGSLPFVLLTATENGTNLSTSTSESAVAAITSGPGTGDFAVVPFLTTFGPITLNDLTVGTGGGLFFSNVTYGSFVASSGSIFVQTGDFLDVTLFGVYTPGPGIPNVSASIAEVDMSFNQTGNSLSGSFTLATVPEPGTLALWGSGLVACWRGFRWRR